MTPTYLIVASVSRGTGHSEIKISADLKMEFKYSKLAYIEGSHENAVTCSELDNCSIFSGSKVGSVWVSRTTESQSKSCDRELPLVTTYKASGKSALDKYNLSLSATLTPWDSTDASTDRKYHLKVFANPDITIHTNPSWPKSVSQSYDCTTKTWVADSSNLGPMINLDESLLKFANTVEVEAYSKSPTTAKQWSFTATEESEDGLTVEEYTATLSIQP